jgi:hypothetical protein
LGKAEVLLDEAMLPWNKDHRELLRVRDYKEALEIFFKRVERIIKSGSH